MIDIQREISRSIPNDVPLRFLSGGIPMLTAYGCALLERSTSKSFVYTAVNLTSGKRTELCRRAYPVSPSGIETLVDKLRQSSVAGAGRLQADSLFGQKLALAKCRETLLTLFNEILPQHGYAVRTEQIALAEHILEAFHRRYIAIAEAEVGTGKTLAYLATAILAKRGRLNDHWNMGLYPEAPVVEATNMPIVVATSSIALQRALMDFAPVLSDILMEHGIIKKPLTAVLRKGREHYVCERNLRSQALFEPNREMSNRLKALVRTGYAIDMAEIDGLNASIKRKIAVPNRCDDNCPYHDSCNYLRFRQQAQSPEIDIQICNHNYLLADVLRRADGLRPLIPNYQCIIIDEAHKFISAAQSMYGTELSSLALPKIKIGIANLHLKNESDIWLAKQLAGSLRDEGEHLFSRLTPQDEYEEEERCRHTADIDAEAVRHICGIRHISQKLIELLASATAVGNSAGRKAQLIYSLSQVHEQAAVFTRHRGQICWLEVDGNEKRLCAVPKDLDRRLYNDIWSKGMPIILTSGTLSANGDFARIKRTLGIEYAGIRLTETSKRSPFDYYKNSLLYISENVPFPDYRNMDYIVAVADEAEKLIRASHGHAAILFTSYKVMDMVWEKLKARRLPFPMFRMDKGGVLEIERFKQSGNGVLFAAGALWEGIDIPGDALSLLIIVKLPFPIPDPLNEYERSLCKDMEEFKRLVLMPETAIKTTQGHGRALRTETDTCVIAFFDIRVRFDGKYHVWLLDLLPKSRVTSDIAKVEEFFRVQKPPEYCNH